MSWITTLSARQGKCALTCSYSTWADSDDDVELESIWDHVARFGYPEAHLSGGQVVAVRQRERLGGFGMLFTQRGRQGARAGCWLAIAAALNLRSAVAAH